MLYLSIPIGHLQATWCCKLLDAVGSAKPMDIYQAAWHVNYVHSFVCVASVWVRTGSMHFALYSPAFENMALISPSP